MGLLAGTVWLTGNLIDFPDGRIGAVSAPNWESAAGITMTRGTGDGECPTGFFCKILRLYTVSGSGTGVALAHDEDIVIADTVSGWPSDDHGIVCKAGLPRTSFSTVMDLAPAAQTREPRVECAPLISELWLTPLIFLETTSLTST